MSQTLRRGAAIALLALAAAACNGAPRDASRAPTRNAAAAEPLNLPDEYWEDLVPPDAFRVLFHEGTERPGSSPLNTEYGAGIYVCAACHLPLFTSQTKFDSGTGWPSFTAPIEGHVGLSEDRTLIVPRTEYHCVRCGGHQGHVFDDGPPPTGQRWCNNGVALKFVPEGDALPPLRGGEAVSAAAVFAGGCFWCMETAFEGVPGVTSVVSGYAGGHTENPTYAEVNTHTTGHVEVVRVVYDPAAISYDDLLDIFWRNVDPTDAGGQFCDRGNTYVSAVFALNGEQRRLAEASLEEAQSRLRVDRPIVTEIRDAAPFHEAEAYHQDYYRKNPLEYKAYRLGCGRDRRLRELWGEKADRP